MDDSRWEKILDTTFAVRELNQARSALIKDPRDTDVTGYRTLMSATDYLAGDLTRDEQAAAFRIVAPTIGIRERRGQTRSGSKQSATLVTCPRWGELEVT